MVHILEEEGGHPVEDSPDRSNLVQTCRCCCGVAIVSWRDPQRVFKYLSRSRGMYGSGSSE